MIESRRGPTANQVALFNSRSVRTRVIILVFLVLVVVAPITTGFFFIIVFPVQSYRPKGVVRRDVLGGHGVHSGQISRVFSDEIQDIFVVRRPARLQS